MRRQLVRKIRRIRATWVSLVSREERGFLEGEHQIREQLFVEWEWLAKKLAEGTQQDLERFNWRSSAVPALFCLDDVAAVVRRKPFNLSIP